MNAPLRELLKETSRSFYLTLRVLPARVRPQIGLAYLLARTTDTIADTDIVPVENRLKALQHLRDRILSLRTTLLDFKGIADHQGVVRYIFRYNSTGTYDGNINRDHWKDTWCQIQSQTTQQNQ